MIKMMRRTRTRTRMKMTTTMSGMRAAKVALRTLPEVQGEDEGGAGRADVDAGGAGVEGGVSQGAAAQAMEGAASVVSREGAAGAGRCIMELWRRWMWRMPVSKSTTLVGRARLIVG